VCSFPFLLRLPRARSAKNWNELGEIGDARHSHSAEDICCVSAIMMVVICAAVWVNNYSSISSSLGAIRNRMMRFVAIV
jgi:hypothetical protein